MTENIWDRLQNDATTWKPDTRANTKSVIYAEPARAAAFAKVSIMASGIDAGEIMTDPRTTRTNKMTRNGLSWFVLLCTMMLSSELMAQDEDKKPKPNKLFESSDTLSITITAPWRTLVRNEEEQGAYPARLEFTDELGHATVLDATVERRGLTRQEVCKYPPIKLRVKKENAKGTTFRGQKSLKMVTHCQKGSRHEQYYILEMLAYQIYNLITDYSFRIRPLSVIYVDSKSGSEQEPRFAFLIEDDSDVAKRNDQKKLEINRTKPVRLEAEQASNFSLFQYLIANLDWSAISGPKPNNCCHNVKLIGHDPKLDPIYPIPYDFDSAGLVNAHYAMPHEKLPVHSVTQRLYRGFCVHNSTLEDARQRFLDNESAVYALIDNLTLLTDRTKKRTRKYLGEFFEVIKDPQEYQEKIIGKCRK
jgi:hypothetical protein